jgi:acetyl esterase/lipase
MQNQIFLFNDAATGTKNSCLEEVIFEENVGTTNYMRIVSGVSRPSIIAFFPKKPNGKVVIFIPGGAYCRQVISEGEDIAEWLNTIGIAVFILKHRMPDDNPESIHLPLQDAQRAVRLIRSRASTYGIDPNKIGILGSSAGGHVASMLGTCYKKQVYPYTDEIDKNSARPDFLVLASPVISIEAWLESGIAPSTVISTYAIKLISEYSTDRLVTKDTPQTFLIGADDDESAPVENCLSFYRMLRKAAVPAELHIYKSGGHGLGSGNLNQPATGWRELCRMWMERL